MANPLTFNTLTMQNYDNDANSTDIHSVLTDTQKQELQQLRQRFNDLLASHPPPSPSATPEPQQPLSNQLASRMPLSTIWQETDDLALLYQQLTDLQKCLHSLRPFSASQVTKLNAIFDIEYTYQSNRIEGNTLTKSETDLIINKGFTVKGKPLSEHLEAINHQEAIDYIREMAISKGAFDKRVLLDIHALILHGIHRQNAGRYRECEVMISGSDFIPPSFLHVPALMDDYFNFYRQHQQSMHPVELASEMHERLVTIHPFVDGNGRTARLVMNLLLLQRGYPITILASDNKDREQYYHSLQLTQTGLVPDKVQFKLFIANNVKQWLFIYLNMLAPNANTNIEKGYYFFKRIEPLLMGQG